ncbi:AlpA family transcriptional regulator [Paraburkholderia strydomiana]|uniref:helix-turn-helix transcriptional regulator n=1 Tax=Paraburkholderia strydomiana TaxID=1245417 RepID=UPI0038BDC8A1
MQTTQTHARILRIQSVSEMTGLAIPTIYLHARLGTFPKQIKLGPRAAGWLASEVNTWIESRAAARGQ